MKKDRVHKFEEFVNESLDNNVWYTTSEEMSIEEFIEIEVEERENYELEEIEEWMEMYNITEDSELLWVATTPAMAARYSMDTCCLAQNKLKLNRAWRCAICSLI